MAIVTKTAKTLLTSQSLAAGGTVHATEWNMSTAFAGSIFVKITNGGTAPTTAPVVTFYAGEATGVKRKLYSLPGDTTNGSVNDFECQYGMQHMFANASITNGSGQAITVEISGQEATSVS